MALLWRCHCGGRGEGEESEGLELHYGFGIGIRGLSNDGIEVVGIKMFPVNEKSSCIWSAKMDERRIDKT